GRDWDPARDRYLEPWEGMLQDGGAGARVIGTLRKARALPDAYLWGIANARAHGKSRRAFLAGEYSLKGWRHFFPFCVLVKTPSAVLGMLCCALLAGMCRRGRTPHPGPLPEGEGEESNLASSPPGGGEDRGEGGGMLRLYRLVPLLTLLCVYWMALLSMNLNIGHRHALATYPAMFILAGGAGAWLRRETRVHLAGTAAVIIMLCTLVVGALSTWPHYLSYFNPMAGGSAKGYKLLVDSSLDWGQDLPGLREWLESGKVSGVGCREEKAYLAYFGKGSPEYYGIDAQRLLPVARQRSAGFQPVSDAAEARRSPGELTGGVYCVSATMLQAVPIVPMGRWCRFYEQDYQRLLLSDEARQKEAHLFRHLRFGRLAAYLRKRQPDDHVGYSILIFRLSDEEVKAALEGPPAELFDSHGVESG
ncbi:hypothetical protein ACFLQU_05730, partial [Verrucomicrobiota bacterium]